MFLGKFFNQREITPAPVPVSSITPGQQRFESPRRSPKRFDGTGCLGRDKINCVTARPTSFAVMREGVKNVRQIGFIQNSLDDSVCGYFANAGPEPQIPNPSQFVFIVGDYSKSRQYIFDMSG